MCDNQRNPESGFAIIKGIWSPPLGLSQWKMLERPTQAFSTDLHGKKWGSSRIVLRHSSKERSKKISFHRPL
jgi:hypothetical protein